MSHFLFSLFLCTFIWGLNRCDNYALSVLKNTFHCPCWLPHEIFIIKKNKFRHSKEKMMKYHPIFFCFINKLKQLYLMFSYNITYKKKAPLKKYKVTYHFSLIFRCIYRIHPYLDRLSTQKYYWESTLYCPFFLLSIVHLSILYRPVCILSPPGYKRTGPLLSQSTYKIETITEITP